MKKYKLMLVLFASVALSYSMSSCGDDDDDPVTEPPIEQNDDNQKPPVEDIDYSSLISGSWTEEESSPNDYLHLVFGYLNEPNGVSYEWRVGYDWLVGEGEFSVNGSKITLSLQSIHIYHDAPGDFYKLTSLGDFTSGQSATVIYSIESCDSKQLVLKDNSGKTHTLKKSE